MARPASSPRLRQRRLTPPEIHQLLAEYQSGDCMKLLATRWVMHPTTVAGHLRRAGITLRRQGVSATDLVEAARLYGEGWSCLRLADHYDCAGETIRQALLHAGVQLRSPWAGLTQRCHRPEEHRPLARYVRDAVARADG